MSRLYPEQFSSSVRKVLEDVSFGPPMLMGSSGDPKVMYSADYDLLEKVMYNGIRTVRAFQKKIELLASKYKITDIKCGENPEWNLLQTKIYNKEKEIEHLRRLWKEKVISDNELNEGERMLKDKLNVAERVAARKRLRFGIYRWTPQEIKDGVIFDRLKKPVRLEDAMRSTGITKIDILTFLKEKYVEISNIILWTRKNNLTFAKLPNVMRGLQEDVAYYASEGNYFKMVKRMLSIAKNKADVDTENKFYEILNSHLGHIYIVIADLQLLNEFPNYTDAKNREHIDSLRDDMAKLYYPEFSKSKDPTKLLPELYNKLQEETCKELIRLKLLPLPPIYRYNN